MGRAHAQNRDLSVVIRGMGVITPLVQGLDKLAGACRGGSPTPAETAVVPPPEGMTARDQRRLARLTRLALYAADCAAEQAGVRGQDAGIYVGLTHGTATYLKEFHDYLFDYGPEMASPNAFSNGVTNAPLGATSLHQKLTQGGATMVGIETGGLEVMHHAASKIVDGTHLLCYVGATEEYADIVAGVYHAIGWYGGDLPPVLPCPWQEGTTTGVGLSEGSAFCVIAPDGPGVRFTPVDDLTELETPVDLIVSGAGGGPQDVHELQALKALLSRQNSLTPVIFPKAAFGETFALGSLLNVAVAYDTVTNHSAYPLYRTHETIADMTASEYDPSTVKRVAVVAGSREGLVLGGVLETGD